MDALSNQESVPTNGVMGLSLRDGYRVTLLRAL